AGSLNPAHVRGTKVDGGYRFSGRGVYVSGCTHASWMLAAAVLYEDGAMKLEGGAPVIRAGVLPMNACMIRETWNVLGMRGTGSHDVEFQDVFVRDVHVVRQHITLATTRYEVMCRVALGMPPGSPLI